MSSFKGIPIGVLSPARGASGLRSGEKYTTRHGFSAIKNGIKSRDAGKLAEIVRKSAWIRVPMPGGGRFEEVRKLVDEHGLTTICKEAKCPNIGECWNAGTATLMLLGEVCTRACRFCAVDTGNPHGWIDVNEPAKAARMVRILGLRYVVLTSVNRDDLVDGGAAHFAATVRAIKRSSPDTAVEALTPDFQGNPAHVDIVLKSGLQVFAQNVETVRRLTHPVRDPRAGYEQTINVLRHAKASEPSVLTKTSLMLGLGETHSEILETMDDLRGAGVNILTLGQYLRPTPNHLPVQRWVELEEFERLRQAALSKGFLECVSGPLVRSSYRAEKVLELNNVELVS